ncbi:Gfo/Idh/MocA family protein [Novosphingobium naphthalenivorans]|uniref:Gfo/Idh/MocA family protein n=1 Tax=Novosphingobium naphthalenivorans TaxID=273168 RepID=UPI0008339151|nr:Gfo/Idh/MocA family oxidoreductase [Novosphingobium naphthalenivorans]
MTDRVMPAMRLGIIGLGGAAKQMMPSFLSHPHVRISAAADPREEARLAFGTEFGARTHATAEALCADTTVDVVYIATPHQMHRDHAALAARAGKHIIIEKPMALTLEECSDIIATAEANGVHLLVGHTHSFDTPILKMRALIREGAIGPVSMINSWNYGNFLYRPRRPEELRTDMGGGIIYNQVPHQIDVVRLLGGGMVRSVRSMAWTLDPTRPTEGAHVTFLQFENGSAASLVYSGYDYFDTDEFHYWIGELGEPKQPDCHAASRRALEAIAGTGSEVAAKAAGGFGGSRRLTIPPQNEWNHPHFGVTIVSGPDGDLRQSARGVTQYGRNGVVEHPLEPPRVFPDKSGVIDEMYDAFSGLRPILHDGAWGRATMEVSEAILRSAREGREIGLSHQVPVRD